MRHKKFIPLAILLLSFFQVFSEDYYWVGGQGTWSDLNSWRTVTGQIPNEVPDAEDNVIFNENSFLQNRQVVAVVWIDALRPVSLWQRFPYLELRPVLR